MSTLNIIPTLLEDSNSESITLMRNYMYGDFVLGEFSPETVENMCKHTLDLKNFPTECVGKCPIMQQFAYLIENRAQISSIPHENFYLRSSTEYFDSLCFPCATSQNVHWIHRHKPSDNYSHVMTRFFHCRRTIPPAESQQKDHFQEYDLECGN